MEPWLDEAEAAVARVGNPARLWKEADRAGVRIVSLIAFPEWAADDVARRSAGLEKARQVAELAGALGCRWFAAPPAGATGQPIATALLAERYWRLAEVCAPSGVRPMLEIWGFSANLRTLADALAVAAASGVDQPAILADVYHLVRGSSPLSGLSLLGGQAAPVFHMNDVPAGVASDRMTDAQRVVPGDGCAPLEGMLARLLANGFAGHLSVELFRDDLWGMEPVALATTCRRRMAAILSRAERLSTSAKE